MNVRAFDSLRRALVQLPRLSRVGGEAGRPLSVYLCGPTVYDHAHIGHGRTYVCFDIVRRVMENVFGIEGTWAMGVTDVDDKIIRRATERGVPFQELAKEFEQSFDEDMNSLNVKRPHVVLRVSEHIDCIIKFVQEIMSRGYAYEIDGSVYFDTAKFSGSGAHVYGKLSAESNVDGGESSGQKKNRSDFALWKGLKIASEPSWESPWGNGRPGWHIECSAMISSVFGQNLDIHGGGIDLAWPHHNNEIAQCEACFGNNSWCEHFMHTGHVSIDGRKMSKSLKNFISLKDLLQEYSSDEFRMFCMQHSYRRRVEYSSGGMETAKTALRVLKDFINLIDSICVTRPRDYEAPVRWEAQEYEIYELFANTQVKIRSALADDFNTVETVKSITELSDKARKHVLNTSSSNRHLRHALVYGIRDYVVNILHACGFDSIRARVTNEDTSKDGARLMQALAEFRATVRQRSLQVVSNPESETSAVALAQQTLNECDRIRSDILANHNILIRDGECDRFVMWEHCDSPASTEATVPNLSSSSRSKSLDVDPSIHPQDMFRVRLNEYSQFDAEGIPTHDAKNEPLSKSLRKKLAKRMFRYAKRFQMVQKGN